MGSGPQSGLSSPSARSAQGTDGAAVPWVGLLHAHCLAWAERLLMLRAGQGGLGRGGGCRSTALTPTLGGDAQRAGQCQRGDGVLVHEGRQTPCSTEQSSAQPPSVPRGAQEEGARRGGPGVVSRRCRLSLPKYSSSLAPRRCTPLAEDSMRKCRTRSLLSSPLGDTEGPSAPRGRRVR